MTSTELLDEQSRIGGVSLGEERQLPQTYRFCRPAMLHFGDACTEYQAIRSAAVVFDLSDRVQIEMTGKDAARFLNNFCTNDVTKLAAGEGCEAFVTNIKGRVLAHLFVFVAEGSVWIETSHTVEEMLLTHFDRYLFSEEVQLHSRTEQYGELFLAGPASVEKLSSVCPLPDVPGILQHTMADCDVGRVAVRRVDILGDTGFLLSVDRTKIVALWQLLTARGILPGGVEAFHAKRIESGFPLYGLDLIEDNLAQEAARTANAISFTKGCYLGQEPIARIDAVGHVNRELRILKLETPVAPETGAVVRTPEGRDVGAITSSARVPGEDRSVALGYVRRSHVDSGSRVVVRMDDREVLATVYWPEQRPETC